MHVIWRNEADKSEGYFLMEGETEIHQAHVKPEQWERARKKKTAIENIVLEDAGQKLAKEKQPRRSVQVVRVEASEHNHDDRYLMGPYEHEHPYALADHEHDTSHTHDEFLTLSAAITDTGIAAKEDTRALRRELIDHDHKDKAAVDHPHHDIEADIRLLMTRMRAQEEHRHEDKADRNHEHPELMQQLASLRVEVAALRELLTTHKHELIGHQHDLPVHDHESYATKGELEALVRAQENARTTTLKVLSKQEVAGKTRFVVEEPE